MSDSFVTFVQDQLTPSIEGICHRRMFGGYGLYQQETFFGIIHGGQLYFKTDASTVDAYKEAGMETFSPNSRQILKTYYQVPVTVLENSALLKEWAEEAIQAAREAKTMG